MSSSWKTHGRSFNSLVKVNKFPQVDVRADDRKQAQFLRNNFQVYNLQKQQKHLIFQNL